MKLQINPSSTKKVKNTELSITVDMETYERLIHFRELLKDSYNNYYPYAEEIDKTINLQIQKLKFDMGQNICCQFDSMDPKEEVI